jgi:predicted SprT family Zn-dependent metalloprotease
MHDTMAITDPSQVSITDTVSFSYHGQELTGTVVKKGRATAHVVCDNQQKFRVPYHRMVQVPHRGTPPVQPVSAPLRAAFSPGDRVQFLLRGAVVNGAVVRVNPTRGYVAADDGREYRVPYDSLQHVEPPIPSHTLRTPNDLASIAHRARVLLATHHLPQWSFQFDNATKRAGSCQYATQVISLSYEFAKRAPEGEITDTLLHEIAHALVGKAHQHDEVWRVKALAIGGSGRRCHDVQFTPPRYIVTCERRCWVATAERRKRGVICKQCRGTIVYETYTADRWQRMRSVSS